MDSKKEVIRDLRDQLSIRYEDMGAGPLEFWGAPVCEISLMPVLLQSRLVVENANELDELPMDVRWEEHVAEGDFDYGITAKLVRYEAGRATYAVALED